MYYQNTYKNAISLVTTMFVVISIILSFGTISFSSASFTETWYNAYAPILKEYFDNENQAKNSSTGSSDKYGYAFHDLNRDGIMELFL